MKRDTKFSAWRITAVAFGMSLGLAVLLAMPASADESAPATEPSEAVNPVNPAPA